MVNLQRMWLFVLAVVVFGAAGAAVLPGTATAKEQCNGTTRPCPLQKWMRENVATPMASGDLAAVAKGIERIRTFGGTGMKDWSKLAKKTVDDAIVNKTDDIKADCKACHDAYKAAYQANPALRNRPLP